jgi:hypothetical protein
MAHATFETRLWNLTSERRDIQILLGSGTRLHPAERSYLNTRIAELTAQIDALRSQIVNKPNPETTDLDDLPF